MAHTPGTGSNLRPEDIPEPHDPYPIPSPVPSGPLLGFPDEAPLSPPTRYGTDRADFMVGTIRDDTLAGRGGDDRLFGGSGSDVLQGGTGDDRLYGGRDEDVLLGEAGNDHLSGGDGLDSLYGGQGNDGLHGGRGRDLLVGGTGADSFFFRPADTGSVFAGQSDRVLDFSDEDTILLQGSYAYAGATAAPVDGQYGVWRKGDAWVVTWNAHGDAGFHDLLLYGANPLGDIAFF